MLFNSFQFLLLFLPAVLLGWWVIFRRPHYRLGYLALMSWIFYSAFEFPTGLMLLPLLLVSTTVDFIAGNLLTGREAMFGISYRAKPRHRKRILIIAMAFNLGLLAIFKYLGFMGSTLNAIAGLFGLGEPVPIVDIILPIGISFYTFNSMSYTIDIYRGRVQPARNLLEYSAFVALFPHLIAGPIVRYSDIDTQLRNLHTKLTSKMVGIGIFFFTCGLVKKLVIADTIAPTVTRLFHHSEELTVISAWAAALGYTMQLYFDFSGYSDMAVGLAMLLGLRFPQNFDSPYKALNPSDFWRRWHMTLSRWLRDYLFIPLGGSRKGKLLTLRNLLITMFLGGLWHGAAWVFVLWGLGHGLLLVIHRVASDLGFVPPWKWLARALTFIAVVILWVPFRAGDIALVKAGESTRVMTEVLGAMFGANGIGFGQLSRGGLDVAAGASVPALFVLVLIALITFVNVAPNTWQVQLVPSRGRAIALGVALGWCMLLLTAPSPFLYFQF
jgi:alginate O-acetyltransferase complex protein AlgI